MLVLDEDQSFSLQANVTSPGFQSVVLSGYITQRRADGVYAAPLIPQLFYGVDGKQLTAWRQYIPSAGTQTILSRVGGQPSVPREELWWRKISDFEEKVAAEEVVAPKQLEVPWLLPALIVASGMVLLYLGTRS